MQALVLRGAGRGINLSKGVVHRSRVAFIGGLRGEVSSQNQSADTPSYRQLRVISTFGHISANQVDGSVSLAR
jgi:hypothetical protein